MERKILWLDIDFTLSDRSFAYSSNIKKPQICDTILNFLRTQIGAGIDNKEVEHRDEYNIKLELDLSFDSFKVKDDCGNLGLRDGILMSFVKGFDKAKEKREK